jgi:glyoxylate carboligase
MAYAEPADLATALGDDRLATTAAELLQACLDAAAAEIDHELDRVDPLPVPAPALAVRTNVNRAVEWFKAPDTYNGGVGFDQTGVLPAPVSGFERHAAALTPLKQRWGVA